MIAAAVSWRTCAFQVGPVASWPSVARPSPGGRALDAFIHARACRYESLAALLRRPALTPSTADNGGEKQDSQEAHVLVRFGS